MLVLPSLHTQPPRLTPSLPPSALQVRQVCQPARIYLSCMELLSRLAGKGLVHCDFNEFNLLLHEESEELTLIDFPQVRVADRGSGCMSA